MRVTLSGLTMKCGTLVSGKLACRLSSESGCACEGWVPNNDGVVPNAGLLPNPSCVFGVVVVEPPSLNPDVAPNPLLPLGLLKLKLDVGLVLPLAGVLVLLPLPKRLVPPAAVLVCILLPKPVLAVPKPAVVLLPPNNVVDAVVAGVLVEPNKLVDGVPDAGVNNDVLVR